MRNVSWRRIVAELWRYGGRPLAAAGLLMVALLAIGVWVAILDPFIQHVFHGH